MTAKEATSVPRVVLGRSGITSTRLGLGCSIWPLKIPYHQVLDTLRTALELGIRHIDVAPIYGTEEIVGRALHDLGIPKDLVLATKACAYRGELGILFRE
jgi:aryl-alcohol dehydrogenase-like predicted oxidoreductase